MFEGLKEITKFLESQFGDSTCICIRQVEMPDGAKAMMLDTMVFVQPDPEQPPSQVCVKTVFPEAYNQFPNPREWAENVAVAIDLEIEALFAPANVNVPKNKNVH